MISNRFTLEHAFYLLALALAISLRLLALGAAPLAEGEAGLAVQAYNVAGGERVALDPQPGYLALTGSTFALFGSSEFTARLWPALAGGLLALVPFFFRRRLGREAALILAFGLALDPGLVAVSRQAGGPMLAAGLTLLALGLAYSGYPILAGIAAGFALLSGPTFLPGVLGLVIAWGLSRLFAPAGGEEPLALNGQGVSSWRDGVLAGLATFVLAGTLFLRASEGLGAWLAELPAYLSGWATPSGVPASRLLAALVVYQPLALIFAWIGALRGWLRGDWLAKMLSIWLAIAILLALLYPDRQVSDLVWALIPLWALAALELARYLLTPSENLVVSLGQAALLFFLMALVWLNIAGLGQIEPQAPDYLARLALIAGVLGLGAVTSSLVGLGWSWQAARQGLVWGVCAALGVYTLAGMWGSAYLRAPGRVELWRPIPASADTGLLMKTLADLSIWKTGETDSIDVTLAVDSPALRWALREYPRLSVVPEGDQLLARGSPSIVITRQDVKGPALEASYRGQDFVIDDYPGWAGALPLNVARWLAFRLAPQGEAQVILWARVDLFPGGALSGAQPSDGLEGP